MDAREPQRVAEVLAELMGGRATPFPPVAQGSWVAHADDDRNTLVEVYPLGTMLVEAEGDADFLGVPGMRMPSSSHFAMATRLSQGEVFAIATREGWPAKYRKRGGAFGVIELWIEGERVVEVLTDAMQDEYQRALTLEGWLAMLAHGDAKHRLPA
nr:hypothetical protein [Novosphingobium profundi]